MHLSLTPGAALLAHPGEDATGDIIVVSAPRCTLLRAAEELGLCKMYSNGNMEAFFYDDRDNFKDAGTARQTFKGTGHPKIKSTLVVLFDFWRYQL